MNAKTIILSIIGLLIFLGTCAALYYLAFYENTIYYTQVDNEFVKNVKTNAHFKYEYTLTSYTDEGKEKSVTFRTTRVLKEDAYLKLKVMLTRGVISWEEVNTSELPEKVKEIYNE